MFRLYVKRTTISGLFVLFTDEPVLVAGEIQCLLHSQFILICNFVTCPYERVVFIRVGSRLEFRYMCNPGSHGRFSLKDDKINL